MKAKAKQSRAGYPWKPALPATMYRRAQKLTAAERAAITAYLTERSMPGRCCRLHDLGPRHPLAELLRPVRDALDLMKSKRSDRGATMAVLLRECLTFGTTFWAWSHGQWLDVLGHHSRAFRDRNQPRVSQSVRLEIAGVAYLHGWFRDVLALGHFQRDVLAKRVFGTDTVDAVAARVLQPLEQWGYRVGTSHLSALCELLLRNESPTIDHVTADVVDRFRRDQPAGKRSLYFQIAKALAISGVLDASLPVAPPLVPVVREDIAAGVAPTWIDWIERWARTSTLDSRHSLRLHLHKLGRWLAAHHPATVEPKQWTRELCAEYVAAVCRMRVGDYTVRKVNQPRVGEPLSPRAMASALVAARTFFWDCQEWGWIKRRFDPGRSLALPRSIKALIGRKPRVIADDT